MGMKFMENIDSYHVNMVKRKRKPKIEKSKSGDSENQMKNRLPK